jgi:hypothetical protein
MGPIGGVDDGETEGEGFIGDHLLDDPGQSPGVQEPCEAARRELEEYARRVGAMTGEEYEAAWRARREADAKNGRKS